MNTGAFGENFPYSNFHDMNMDWVIKIAKDFLDQYTNLQNTITAGLTSLEEKKTELEQLLQAWYDEHSEDIAEQLRNALADLENQLNISIERFTQAADRKAAQTIQSIPSDYTTLSRSVENLPESVLMAMMNINPPIIDANITPVTGPETFQATPSQITTQNASVTAEGVFSGIAFNRNFINFNDNAFYILALQNVSFADAKYGLIVHLNSGTLYSISMGTATYRTYSTPLNVGNGRGFKAYFIGNNIYAWLKGALNIINITTMLIIPGREDLGYFTQNDIVFGIAYQGNVARTFSYLSSDIKTSLFTDNIYYALGDSVTAGSWSDDAGNAYAEENAEWAYPKQIANTLNCTLHNLGHPGWTSDGILNGSNTRPSEVSQVNSDATIITIMCGTNDYRENVGIGTYQSTEPGTVCGNLYQIIKALATRAPKARIIVISPIPGASRSGDTIHYRRTTPNEAGWTYDDLESEYYKLCKLYGVEYVNCTTKGPINTFNLFDMMGDGSHPKKDTYDSLAQYIYANIF